MRVRRPFARPGAGSLPPGGRDARALLLARTLMSGQRALVSVVVPIYLARLGHSATWLALLFAAVALSSTVLSVAVGALADRLGPRMFVIGIPLLAAGAALAYAYTDDPVAVFAFAALGTFGRGSGAGAANIGPYQPAEQALLAGLVDDRERPRLFGWVASASAAGGLLGAAVAALPITDPGHPAGPVSPATYRLAFLVAAGLAAAAGLTGLAVRDRQPAGTGAAPHPATTATTATTATRRARQRARGRLSDRGRSIVARLWVTNVTNGVAVGLFGPFITYWLYRRFGAGTGTIGMLYIAVNLVTILTNQLAAPITARLGDVRTVVLTRSAQALLLVPLALAPGFAVAGAVYALRMCVQRIGLAVRTSFVMTTADAYERARIAALSQLPSQGTSALAPLATGYLFEEVSLSAPFEIAAVFQLANALSFGWLFRRAARERLARAGADAAVTTTR